MKKKEREELKNKTTLELEGLLKESRSQLRTLKFDLAAGKVKNINAIRELKKTIARILTWIHETQRKTHEQH